jgi:hypothetical protein
MRWLVQLWAAKQVYQKLLFRLCCNRAKLSSSPSCFESRKGLGTTGGYQVKVRQSMRKLCGATLGRRGNLFDGW